MSSLRELQERFVGALFGELPDGDPCVAIYRNNLHAGFAKALRAGFPVIERLVGPDYFRQLAGEFQRAHPSRAGDLHNIGGAFPGYLRARYDATEYAYLADVAALEWAYQQSAVAADAATFQPESLAGVAPEDYGRLQFKLHPACCLVESSYPILRIWESNQSDCADGESIDLGGGGDHVLTRRLGNGTELRRIPAGMFALLQAFSLGLPLAAAFDRAQRPGFDLGEALGRCVALGLFAAAHLENLQLNEGSAS